MRRISLSICCTVLLTACAKEAPEQGAFLKKLPEGMATMAAPNQDLATVTLLDDGCYWYQHKGPVETTLLPLVARNGGHICTTKKKA